MDQKDAGRRYIEPTTDNVKRAVAEFDENNGIGEQALKGLFGENPRNDSHPHVLLKVVTLNGLYATNIYAVYDVAIHIHQRARELDALLSGGSPDALNLVANIEIKGRKRRNYSFATKYCSWHNPTAYPIYDSYVDACLWYFKKRDNFAQFVRQDLCDYPEFLKAVIAFRSRYQLEEFDLKQLDKFLVSAGTESAGLTSGAPDTAGDGKTPVPSHP